MKKIFLAAFIITQMAGAYADEYMGHKVTSMSFPVAGGETIALPVTDAGPIPAEDANIKIEMAGFNVAAIPGQDHVPGLTWVFGFKSKLNQNLESVVVEEVFASANAVTMINDEAPRMKGATWSSHSEFSEVTPDLLSWLYSNKSTTFVYKFTIKMEGDKKVVLYQPVWFSEKTKKVFIDLATKLRNAS